MKCKISIVGGKKDLDFLSKGYENKGEFSLTREQIRTEIRRLIEVEKHSIRAAAERCGLSLTTVRRICRTLKVGPYSEIKGGRKPKSSQVPYGWMLEEGRLYPNVAEVRWVQFMRRMREAGASYDQIADKLNDAKVPTKNLKKWSRRVVWRILKTNPKSGE